MVEYGMVTSVVAVLASALAGLVTVPVVSLPATNGKATALVASTARAQHVNAAKAATVYRLAPYRKPFLRYLYTAGWMSGSRNLGWCRFDKATNADPADDATAQIRKSPKLVARLDAAHISVATAASAVGKGMASACS